MVAPSGLSLSLSLSLSTLLSKVYKNLKKKISLFLISLKCTNKLFYFILLTKKGSYTLCLHYVAQYKKTCYMTCFCHVA